MIWVDREVKKIKERHLPLEWVDDMKTPSGRIHVGSLRGVVIHDLIYKVLQENAIKSKYTYVFDDHDPMDAIPSYLDFSRWEKYAGMQLYQIPSPQAGYKNYAQYYAQEFIEVFQKINCHPKIIWASELYNTGKMNTMIKTVLDAAPKIREIYFKIAKAKKAHDWHPFNVVCEKCHKIGTTYVYHWDGRLVHYRCQPQMVAWAKGCGHQGKISPFNGNGKIPWKVEWAAKWKVIGVTIEGAGKDHLSQGGSYDVASAICRQVINYPPPYSLAYEWFTIGGKKMSSSKGVGSSAKEISQILPPDIFRFLMVRVPINTHIDFNPYGETILNLFDDYDRCLNAYFDKIENKLPEGKQGEVLSDFSRIIELSQVKPLPKKRLFLPRFRTVVNLLKIKNNNLINFFETQKKTCLPARGNKLTPEEKEILEERIIYAQIYLKNYSQEQDKIEFSKESSKNIKLTTTQKLFLKKLVEKIKKMKKTDRESLQQMIYSVLKENNFSGKEVFPGFYQILINRDFGPKAADLILELGKENFIKKVEESLT